MTPPVEPRGCSAGRLPVVNTKSWMGVAWQRQRLHRIRDATVMGDDGRGDGTCPLRRRGGLVRRACRLVNSSRGTADRTARGRGSGWCLDVGCGTGIHLSALAETGWSVVGVDASADQLRVARRRAGPVGAGLVRADAARLPFRAGSCPLVVSAFTHTDVEDFTSLAREARRVLEADGRFIYVGLHPCLPAPSPSSHEPMAPAWSIPGYARPGWQTGGPGSVGGGLTSRVGFRHLPIARVLNDVLEAELRLCRVEEVGMSELPEWLALVAQR
jgi:SAM-dependent methyltransferase